MATISRAQLLKELLPGLNTLFGLTYNTYDNQHAEIFEMGTSDRSFEEDLKLSGFGAAPVKAEGAAIAYDTAQEAYTARYVHETIAMGFSITEEAIEDNLYASLSARYTKALARGMAHTKQVKAAAVLNNGFNGAFLGGDGTSLFGNNSGGTRVGHPLVSGGVNHNSPTTGVDLNETSLEAAIIQISKWTDERGLLINAKPKKLIIPPDLMFIATRLLDTELRSSVQATPATYAPNDVNAIKTNGMLPGGYKVNNFLTDPNAWFIITDIPDGLKGYQRVKLSTKMEGDFDTGNVKYKARERYKFGWSDPMGVWGSAGA